MHRLLQFALCLLALSVLPCAIVAGELRGVWLARDSLTSKDAIALAMDRAASNNFNVVYVNAWSRGYPLWRSQVFSNETGIAIDPTYSTRDIMAEAVAEGHRVGLHVVAWMEYGFVGGYTGYLPGVGGKGLIFDTHPDWVAQQQDGTEIDGSSFYWMSHTRPDVQQFLINLTKELVAKYDLDGVELDRIRLSSLAYGYDNHSRTLYASENGGQQPPTNTGNAAWIRWRADKLNAFHAAAYDAVKSLYPRFIVGNAPSAYGSSTYTAYNNTAQDWVWWIVNNKVDSIELQSYVASPTSFSNILHYVAGQVSNRISVVNPSFAIRPGGAWVPYADIPKFVDVARAKGCGGNGVWYYVDVAASNYFTTLLTNSYSAPAAPGYLPTDWRAHRDLVLISNTVDAVRTGAWTPSANAGYAGGSIYASNGAPATIDYHFDVPTNGIYEVYAYTVVSGNRATAAPFQLFDAYENSTTNFINQTLTANTRWIKVGDVLLSAGRRRVVRLSNNAVPAGQLVSADAMMISLNRRLSEVPALSHFGVLTNGAFPLKLGGNVGQRLRIEVSTNLLHWTPLATVTLTNAQAAFTDNSAAAVSHRFYRASLAP